MVNFKAEIVETHKETFSEDFAVFSLFFEEGDPEEGGESWNFQRALGNDGTLENLGEDDEGVCAVKEIQQETFYDGIESFELSRNSAICIFKEGISRYSKLHITYDIDDSQWENLKTVALLVFKHENYFSIGETR